MHFYLALNFILLITFSMIWSSGGHMRNKTLNLLHLSSSYSGWYPLPCIAFAASLLHSQSDILPEYNVEFFSYHAEEVSVFKTFFYRYCAFCYGKFKYKMNYR